LEPYMFGAANISRVPTLYITNVSPKRFDLNVPIISFLGLLSHQTCKSPENDSRQDPDNCDMPHTCEGFPCAPTTGDFDRVRSDSSDFEALRPGCCWGNADNPARPG
jgi:hypothetical protein